MARIGLYFTLPQFGRAAAALAGAPLPSVESQRAGAVTCWTLPAGQAMRFTATSPGALRVSRGRVWLTFSHRGFIDSCGRVGVLSKASVKDDDLMLETGQSVVLAAGESVVFEPFATAGPLHAGLQWRSHVGAA